MAEFLSPGTKVSKVRKGAVVPMTGTSTAIGGFQGITTKGPVAPTMVTSVGDFEELYGARLTTYPQVWDDLAAFFAEGGSAAYINRTTGTGALAASRTLSTTGPASYGTTSCSAGPWVMSSSDTLTTSVITAGGGPVSTTFTVAATAATYTCTGGTYAGGGAGDILVLNINGVPGNQTIDLTATGATQQAYCDDLNAGLIGAKATISAGNIIITTDRKGSGAGGNIVSTGSGTLAAKLGVSAGAFTNAGPNNVVDVRAVTGAEVATGFSGLANATMVANGDGTMTLTHTTAGATSSVAISAACTLDTVMGWDNVVHSGAASTTVSAAVVTASSVGAWGNSIKAKAVRVDTAMCLSGTVSAGTYTSVAVANGSKFMVGDQVSCANLSGTMRGTISSIDGNTLTFTASVTVPTGGFNGTQTVYRETWDLYVYDSSGVLIAPSPFKDLRCSSLAGVNYFVEKVNNTSRTPVLLTNSSPAASDPRPNTDSSATLLSSGSDGAAIALANYLGSPSTRTGIYNWDNASDVNFISISGVADILGASDGASLLKSLEAYAESRGDVQLIVSGPEGYDYTAIKTWVTSTANFSSQYTNVYWPKVYAIDAALGVKKLKPPTGYVQGIIARTHKDQSFAAAPAGIVEGQIRSIFGLEYDIKENSAEYDSIYPEGINAILNFPGEGYAVWGIRTQDATGEYGTINEVTGFIVAEKEFKKRTRSVNFKNNDVDTRGFVTRTMTALFADWRRKKILQGETNDEAFFIICDETNNTPLVISQYKLVCRIGLAFNKAAQFVECTLEQDTRAVEAALAK